MSGFPTGIGFLFREIPVITFNLQSEVPQQGLLAHGIFLRQPFIQFFFLLARQKFRGFVHIGKMLAVVKVLTLIYAQVGYELPNAVFLKKRMRYRNTFDALSMCFPIFVRIAMELQWAF